VAALRSSRYIAPTFLRFEEMMTFQLVEVDTDPEGGGIVTTPTRPLFELADDAFAMAEFAAARCGTDYGYDADADCWWAARDDGHIVVFIVRPASDVSLDAA
jgi:hypothetical protein